MVAKSPARGQSPKTRKTMRSRPRRGGYDGRGSGFFFEEDVKEETMSVGIKGGEVKEVGTEEGTERYY